MTAGALTPDSMQGRSLWWLAGLLVAVVVALTLRLPRLGERPMHADEAVHAIKFVQLLDEGRYTYDPNEFHGPSLYYLTLPFVLAAGEQTGNEVTEATLRLVPLTFGAALILLLPLTGSLLGRGATVAAAVLLAVSPAMVYYSRYFIHELLLVVFTWLWIAGGWRWWKNRRLPWLLLSGAALGLMHATKETFVFNLAVAAPALVIAWWWERRSMPAAPDVRGVFPALGLAALVALAVSVLFFTSFFTHEKGLLQGPLDSIRTYVPWITRAGGESPHVHPWTFYFERLLWWQHGEGPVFTELLVAVLALVGMMAAFTRRGLGEGTCTAFVRFLALYTLALMAIYTVISYKTPWCLLGWYHGVVLLAGVGVAALWRWLRPVWAKVVLSLVLLAGVTHLSQQACRAAFTYAAEPANPWVYAHTSRDLLRLVKRVQGVAAQHPARASMVVKVIAPGGDYWPLPWYLRSLPSVGYYAAVPQDPFADAVIMGSRISVPLDDMSEKEWIMAGYYQLRPKVFLSFYPKFELWKDYIESLPPPDEEEDGD